MTIDGKLLEAIEMHWLIDVRNRVLEAGTDKKAARALHDGDGNPRAALIDRARFLRACWGECPITAEDLTEAASQHAAQEVATEIEATVDEVSLAMRAVVGGALVPASLGLNDKALHHKFVYYGLRHLESVTHYNPWSEATSRASRVLSNKTDAPFTLYDTRFASAESFLQSMRLRPGSVSPSRAAVAGMPSADAQSAGRSARRAEKVEQDMDDPVWLWGQEDEGPLERRSPDFREVMTEALIAKVRSHDFVAQALSACAALPVVHYVRRRWRYRINPSSHLRSCLPNVLVALGSDLPTLTDQELGDWLRPSSADVQLA